MLEIIQLITPLYCEIIFFKLNPNLLISTQNKWNIHLYTLVQAN